MSKSDCNSHEKSGKASFEEIYNAEDPRGYFTELGKYGYETPDHGRRVFSELLDARRSETVSSPSKVVDLCCSYGINGALLKCDLTLDDLYDRYRSPEMRDLSSEELVASDTEFYSDRCREHSPEVVGVDISRNAVTYGVEAGMLDAGFAENLEDEEPTQELREAVVGADMVTVTGGIGYVSEKTFDRVLGGMEGEVPWVACFALRWVDYERYAGLFERYGLVTEKLEGYTFPQRRFTDDEEREYVLKELGGRGLETEGRESEGVYHAEFYLSRPAAEIEENPVAGLLEAVILDGRSAACGSDRG